MLTAKKEVVDYLRDSLKRMDQKLTQLGCLSNGVAILEQSITEYERDIWYATKEERLFTWWVVLGIFFGCPSVIILLMLPSDPAIALRVIMLGISVFVFPAIICYGAALFTRALTARMLREAERNMKAE